MKKIKTELTSGEIGQLQIYYAVGANSEMRNKRDARRDRKILKFINCLEPKE